jgi:hypothetical protein
MSRSTGITVSQTFPIRRIRPGFIALWGLQIGLATLFLFAGGSKLAAAPAMVALFEAIGVGQWFRFVTGLIEVASAVALLVPALAPFGALLLASTMLTVFTEGDVTFDDPQAGHGTLDYGGVEWVRAGKGMWHGKELSAGTSPTAQGFQLWIALPPDLETAEPDAQYIVSEQIPVAGPARVMVGSYVGAASPVRAPGGINYLLVTLKPGERWTYEPPTGHHVAWVAVGRGALQAGQRVSSGELAIFDHGAIPIALEGVAGTGATFVLGSAVPHP